MVFAPGLPLLWPIAFAACFTFYFVDLFLLLKYYQRPPSYNEKIGKYTISVFEYSVFVNALFCIWLYGNQSILASQDVVEGGSLAFTQLQSYAGFSSTNVTLGRNRTLDDDNDYMSHINVTSRKKYIEGTIFDTMISRITRAHTFFLFLLICILLFYKALNSFFTSIWGYLSNIFCPGKNANGSVRFNPPLTSTFVRPLDPLATHAELKRLKKAGIDWKVKSKEEECDLGMEATFKGTRHTLTKKSKDSSRLKYTWEVIKESGLHTYDIAENPNYADVMRFLNDHNKQRAARIEKGLTLDGKKKQAKKRKGGGVCSWDNFFVCCATG